ncbi:HEPN domain-containing protein [Saccharopolyspora sp. SCSIO 74807]|uniref:HEPN domain-containing protein n=1 Tax=Saccharopolyspora sp. SCSIO 74807 TaxID=3118084 RepID=UPI0030CE60F8
MAAHDDLVQEIVQEHNRFSRRVDQLKMYMLHSATLAQGNSDHWIFVEQESRGAAVVGICAELEHLTRFAIGSTHSELNSLKISYKELSPCLRQLAAHEVFESLRDLRDHKKIWDRRRFATTLDVTDSIIQLPVTKGSIQPPLDGKTLKPEHYYRIWAIYGLPNDTFPQVSWGASLQKAALMRNDIAHGNLPFAEIFKQAGSSSPEVERYVDEVSAFAQHFTDTWITYIAQRQYLVN